MSKLGQHTRTSLLDLLTVTWILHSSPRGPERRRLACRTISPIETASRCLPRMKANERALSQDRGSPVYICHATVPHVVAGRPNMLADVTETLGHHHDACCPTTAAPASTTLQTSSRREVLPPMPRCDSPGHPGTDGKHRKEFREF